jgi:hypothetical protein
MTQRDRTSRVIRPGQVVPRDDDWLDRPVAERVAAVWELTLLSMAWRRKGDGETRLQRSIVRIHRPGDGDKETTGGRGESGRA